MPEGLAVTRDRARKKSVRAQMAASGEPYSVAARKLGRTAALLHSVARNHALIDGNKRLALAAVIAFYGLNGRRLTLTNDAAYGLVINVAAGQLDAVDSIAAILRPATRPR